MTRGGGEWYWQNCTTVKLNVLSVITHIPEYALKLTYCTFVALDQRANVMLLWDKGNVGGDTEWFIAELYVWEVHCKTGN